MPHHASLNTNATHPLFIFLIMVKLCLLPTCRIHLHEKRKSACARTTYVIKSFPFKYCIVARANCKFWFGKNKLFFELLSWELGKKMIQFQHKYFYTHVWVFSRCSGDPEFPLTVSVWVDGVCVPWCTDFFHNILHFLHNITSQTKP